MKPSEVLDKAAAIIERDGWIQGVYYQEPPAGLSPSEYARANEEAKKSAPCCQRGAVVRAVTGTWGLFSLLPKADREVIRSATWFARRLTGNHPIEWNDAPGRTKEEVVDMLKKAADQARGAGK